jgi:hypothetical protein
MIGRIFALFLFLLLFAAALPAQEKVKVEELLARHLNAIGSAEARAKAISRVAGGKSNFFIRIGGSANLDGTAMMVSAGPKLRFGLRFPAPDYPGEDIACDGNRAATGLLPQGGRSPLSRFLNSQSLPLKEGLLGGVLSTAWPLLRVDQLKPQLEYRGLKKIDDKVWHEVGYRARKGGGDLKVMLYFQPETWRHMRSKYSFEIGASIGTREASNTNQESYFSLTEDFDDFREVDGLTLPHKHRLQYSGEGRGGSSLHEWTFIVSRISHGETLEDQIFVIK